MKILHKLTAFFVSVSVTMVSSGYSVAIAEEFDSVSKDKQVVTKVESDTYENPSVNADFQLEPMETAMENCRVLDYVDDTQFNSSSFSYRITEQEDLNTYVFLDENGDKTVYLLDENVKYVNSDGVVIEKDLSLYAGENGYEVTQSDIGLVIPYSLSDGVSMEYLDNNIVIIPNSISDDIIGEEFNGSVIYNGVFDENTSLIYTPLLSGVKEDILLSEYVENATYSFTVKADGMSVFNSDDNCFFAKSDDSLEKFSLGMVEVYDAVGRPGTGTINVEPIEDGAEFLVHITADDEFLADPMTVYPVTIDPTITVSDNTHGSNSIVDASIFSGYPDSNFGGFIYDRVGTPSSAYGVGRTVVKLSGLTNTSDYKNMIADQITNVSFYVKEGAGSSSQYINLYPLTNTTWTETTVTWNNIGNYNTSNNYGNNLTNNQWTAFDITNLVKGWKNGTYSADAGFILTNSNEKSDECFCSSEHATSSYRPYVVVTYNSSGSGGGNSFNNATNLSLNTSASVNVAYADEKRYFKFTPSTTGFYTFESSAISSGDPKAWLYNSSKIELLNNDDGGTGNNFRLTYHLIMGQNYYFVAGCYNTGVGSYNVTISKTTIPSYVAAATINQRNVYTISTNAANKATFYKFTPTQTGEYLFYSSERTGDPKIWLYNSSLSMVGSNDDGAGNLNFRLNVTLTAGQSYYIVAAHLGANTGTYKLNSLFDANIPNSIFYLKNIENSLYIDIDGPGAQEWVHQWSLHTDPQEKWRIKKQDDGYYTIQSEYSLKKYIGISNTNIETNNIKLYSSVSDAARWKIFSTYDGKLIIEPKTAPGKIMCSPNSTAGQELQLSYLYTNDTSHMNKWQLKTATLTINPYYDNAFNVRYTNAANLVESFSPEISRIMWDALGVRVTYNSPKMILSTPDRCKLERGLSINSTNIDVNSDARCPANPSYSNPNCPYYDINKVGHYGWENCTSWYQSYRDFINQYPGNSTTVSVLFNGSRLYDDSGLQCNRSFHWYSNGIILQEIRSSSSSYSSDILPCFLHELSHDLDAPDHYHEMLKDDAGTYYCRGGDMCITCHPETGRAGWCIMRSGWRSDLLTCEPDEIYCEECKNDILEHLGKHHFE